MVLLSWKSSPVARSLLQSIRRSLERRTRRLPETQKQFTKNGLWEEKFKKDHRKHLHMYSTAALLRCSTYAVTFFTLRR